MSRASIGRPLHVLVTGGAGYIGSHACVALLQAGHSVTVYDNLCNSSAASLAGVQAITGRDVPFVMGDVCDRGALARLFGGSRFDAVLHFAGLKSVAESVENPLDYYHTNFGGTLRLMDAMRDGGPRILVFSSSATVYGEPDRVPVDESAPCRPASPYGRSKLMTEQALRDMHASGGWRIACLRYFNPVGAHPSGLIGEDPLGKPNNLMPVVSDVAVGRRSHVGVFGDDYPTPDGTGVRDYIHVMDLVEGHVAALAALAQSEAESLLTLNLGTGRGVSVREMIAAFEHASGRDIVTRTLPRRAGDVACYYADPGKAREVLGWAASRGLDSMCKDAWRWRSTHPAGFAGLPVRPGLVGA